MTAQKTLPFRTAAAVPCGSLPGAREHGTRDDRSGEGKYPSGQAGAAREKPDGYTEEAAAPLTVPNRSPYRTTEKPFTDAEAYPTGAHRASRRSCCTVTGGGSLAEYRGETREGKAFGFSSTRRNRCSA